MKKTWLLSGAAGLLILLGLAYVKASELSPDDAHRALFAFDATLGWRPRGNVDITTRASRRFRVVSNAMGFRDSAPITSSGPTLLFAGDSFTWGYDVDNEEIFTEKIRPLLPEWQIHNQGVSAYGTDQTYLLLEETLPKFQPKAVMLVFCTDNDRHDNTHSRHGKYDKPAFRLVGNELIPVNRSSDETIAPDPTFALLEATRAIVETSGAIFWVALTGHEPEVERFLAEEKIPHAVLTGIERFPGQGNHWTAAGHAAVANRISNFVRAETARNGGDRHSGNRRSSKVSRKLLVGN